MVSLEFTNPHTMVITVSNLLVCNIGGIGFTELPCSHWQLTKLFIGFVLARFSEKGPCGALRVCGVCVNKRKMKCSSSGLKICTCFIVGTLGFFRTSGFSWNRE